MAQTMETQVDASRANVDLRALLERVKAATGRLDNTDLGRLICVMQGDEFGGTRTGCGDDGSDELEVFNVNNETVWVDYRRRAPDASLDVALELLEKVRFGWAVQLQIWFPSISCRLFECDLGGVHKSGMNTVVASAATLPLALLAALISAKLEQSDD